MNNKKKQTAVVAMATVLSVTSIASPLAVMAQEDTPVPPAIVQEEMGQQKTAPDIVLPESLQAMAGTALEEIPLPEHWTWTEKSTVITAETAEYPARFSVDDVTYDYSNVEGYNPEGHYVECMVAITVETAKSEPVKPEPAEVVQENSRMLKEDTPTTFTAGDIEINETNFPDKGFRDWLTQQGYGGNGTITQDEIAGITEIDVIGKTNIKDLTGIEYFTALTRLLCNRTGITRLDVSKNTALETLYCEATGITSLDVSNNKRLAGLWCHNAPLAYLNVGDNTGLSVGKPDPAKPTIYVATDTFNLNDKFSGIDITKISNLKDADWNSATGEVSNFTYVQPITYDYDCGTARAGLQTLTVELTVTNNLPINADNFPDEAFRKYITDNFDTGTDGILSATEIAGITEIDVSGNTSIKSLTGIRYFTALTNLNCSGTGITNFDVSNNKELTNLDCSGTVITSLDVSQNTKLISLECSNAPLAYLNIGNNKGLSVSKSNPTKPTIYVETDTFMLKDKFSGIDIKKISNLNGADWKPETGEVYNYADEKPITYDYDCGTSIGGQETLKVELTINGIALNDINFPDKTFRAYITDNFDKDTNGILSTTEIAGIKEIDVSALRNIKDLTGIEYFTALTELNCSYTGITTLDVSNNKELTNLKCQYTEIKNLDVSNNKALTTLWCDRTEITSLDVSNNKALTNLACVGTGITKLDVSNNKALTVLSCYETRITSLDVSNNKALTELYCERTGITSLDVSNNKDLTTLMCWGNSSLKSLKVEGATALTTLNCNFTGIESLDVSTNKALTELYCYNTGIESLDVSNNKDLTTLMCWSNSSLKSLKVDGATALTKLNCEGTGITSLDIRTNTALTNLECAGNASLTSLKTDGATALTDLICSNTGITSLDVSKNKALTELICSNTGITSLDVSKNTALTLLNCGNTPLAYLNIGANNNLIFIYKNNLKLVNVEVTGDSFRMADKFVGIEVDKISNVKGADYNNGVMSNYSIGTPITYTYDCGTSNNGAVTLDVTLNLIRKSTISITDDMNKTYDGIAVNASPTVRKSGSTGAVSYRWEQKKNATDWEDIASAPTDAGTYRVTATLVSDSDYPEATSAPVEFTISQATNGWTENLAIKDWTYGEKANTPTAKASFGDVAFTYSNSKDGTYTDKVPTTAGTWYVKATVTGTDNYTTLETVLAFTIAPKSADNNSQIIIPSINSDKDVENLVIKDGDKVLEKGTDYEVAKTQDGNKVTVTITFKGNYTGTVTRSYTVEEKTPAGGDKDDNKSNGTKTDNQNTDDKKAVETGDSTSVGLWSSLLAFSAGIAVFLKRKKQRKETEE